MKFMTYQIMQETNAGTAENPDIRKELRTVTYGPMSDKTFEANYAIAEKEAYNSEITVEDMEDPETDHRGTHRGTGGRKRSPAGGEHRS